MFLPDPLDLSSWRPGQWKSLRWFHWKCWPLHEGRHSPKFEGNSFLTNSKMTFVESLTKPLTANLFAPKNVRIVWWNTVSIVSRLIYNCIIKDDIKHKKLQKSCWKFKKRLKTLFLLFASVLNSVLIFVNKKEPWLEI